MKTTIIIVMTFLCASIRAQISEGGMPYSFSMTQLKSQKSLPEKKLARFDEEKLKEEDARNPTPIRYSIFEEVNVDLKSGTSSPVNEPQGTIWRYVFSSERGYSVQIIFKIFKIPPGAKLFLYNDDYSVIFGAFTSENGETDNSFTVADFPDKKVIVEYFEPIDAQFSGELVVGSVGQSYRNIEEKKAEENSYIDINCEEGKNWQNEKHAVCKITFKVGNSGYLCSGALINNTENDGTPYFLTANHCISDTSAAKTLVAYFNYEKKSCSGVLDNGKTLTGSRLLSTGTKSDYTLLKLNSTPPPSYMPFYAGWDISNYSEALNTSIHHPGGIEKKISVDYDKISTYDNTISWDEGQTTPPSSHWLIIFDKGTTSQGSSGGPLFSKQKRIIGQLHGGDNDQEFYGKLSYSWNNASPGYSPLRTFLDPKNTGTKILNGFYPFTNLPDAFFITSFSKVCINTPITLNDYSAFTPTSYIWTISPSSFSFVNGTNQNSVSPQVRFNSAGSYSVKLK
ncbi:MAG TPA: serine protease, partial [Bacteroidales bacterium]|nr:serine protease [Bacteroidales bacterium]